MKQKTSLTIAILSLTAVALLTANWILPKPADAQVVISKGDYVAGTATTSSGNDALYLVNNRTGQVAIFVYDPGSRSLQVRAMGRLTDAFAID
jgi:hypothetical protein